MARGKTPGGDNPDVSEKTLFARRTRQVIGWISGGLALFFTWLQLSGIPVQSVLNTVTPDIIWRAALIIYYLAWTAGTLFDTDIQEIALAEVPNRGKWPVHTFGVVAVLGIAAFVLCWAQGDIEKFAIALTIFVIVDHAGWQYLIWLLRDPIEKSQAVYRSKGDLFANERLEIVSRQIQGKWKWVRLVVVGIPLVLLIDAFAFFDSIRIALGKAVVLVVPGLQIQDGIAIAAAVLILMFVLGMEIWHWTIRINTRVSLGLLDELKHHYKLVRLPNS